MARARPGLVPRHGVTYKGNQMRDLATTTANGQLNGHGRESNHSQSVNRSQLHRIGGPVSVAWREGTLTRAYELEALCEWITAKHSRDGDQILVGAVMCHLGAARDAALGRKLDP